MPDKNEVEKKIIGNIISCAELIKFNFSSFAQLTEKSRKKE
jgi:hypothetical protein